VEARLSILPLQVPPTESEGVVGLMLRLFELNAVSTRDLLVLHRDAQRKHVLASDADFFSRLSGLPRTWFEWRLPMAEVRDRWTEVMLFGHRWRNDWLLRGVRQQVCPICLAAGHRHLAIWDLQCYAACHVHRVVLQDLCAACSCSITPDRPGVEICACGRYLTGRKLTAVDAPPRVVAWSDWLAEQLRLGPATSGMSGDWLPPEWGRVSPDGAYRMIQAFAGGPRAFRGALLNSVHPWLSSAATVELLDQGLRGWEGQSVGNRTLRRVDSGGAAGLKEQSIRGVSVADRETSLAMIADLGIRPRWRDVYERRYQYQLQLFDKEA